MKPPKEYRFKIDSYSPETIPMARLAEYMARVADLLGFKQSVHFNRLERGSAVLVQTIDEPDIPKVRDRLNALSRQSGEKDAQKAFEQLDQMLAKDNAIGSLIEDEQAEVIQFPGRTRPQPVTYGPFNEQGSLSGILINIGGKDSTVPVHILDREIRYPCNANRDLARQLAQHLFAPVRVTGTGKWIRNEDGSWVMDKFNIHSFEVLDEAPLSDAVAELRNISDSGWQSTDDPMEELRVLRNGDNEIH